MKSFSLFVFVYSFYYENDIFAIVVCQLTRHTEKLCRHFKFEFKINCKFTLKRKIRN